MSRIGKLIEDLDGFKNDRRNELEFNPIEKWMIGDLGVKKLSTGKGSSVLYKHVLLEQENVTGHFTVHLKHVKRNIIYRKNFLAFLYPTLMKIIRYLALEDNSA